MKLAIVMLSGLMLLSCVPQSTGPTTGEVIHMQIQIDDGTNLPLKVTEQCQWFIEEPSPDDRLLFLSLPDTCDRGDVIFLHCDGNAWKPYGAMR